MKNPTMILWLSGYLTPSENVIRSSHWTTLHRMKKQLSNVIESALLDMQSDSLTTITSLEAAREHWTNSDTKDSFPTTILKASKPIITKSKSKRNRNKAR